MGLQQDNWLISLVAVLHHVKITPICEWDCNLDLYGIQEKDKILLNVKITPICEWDCNVSSSTFTDIEYSFSSENNSHM